MALIMDNYETSYHVCDSERSIFFMLVHLDLESDSRKIFLHVRFDSIPTFSESVFDLPLETCIKLKSVEAQKACFIKPRSKQFLSNRGSVGDRLIKTGELIQHGHTSLELTHPYTHLIRMNTLRSHYYVSSSILFRKPIEIFDPFVMILCQNAIFLVFAIISRFLSR